MTTIDSQSSLPLTLQPMNWCGKKWRQLKNFSSSSTTEKVGQVFLRIIPAIALLLAYTLASAFALIGQFPLLSKTIHITQELNESQKTKLRSQNINENTPNEDLSSFILKNCSKSPDKIHLDAIGSHTLSLAERRVKINTTGSTWPLNIFDLIVNGTECLETTHSEVIDSMIGADVADNHKVDRYINLHDQLNWDFKF